MSYVVQYSRVMTPTQQLIYDMLASGAQTAKQIVAANTFSSGYTRRAFLVLEQRARNYSSGREGKTWIAMPGLRGTGKSTLLAQMHGHAAFRGTTKIYASFDRIKTVNGTIQDKGSSFFVCRCQGLF